MRKPAAIRKLLTDALPALQRDPELLVLWIDKGKVRTRQTANFSYAVEYTLNIVIKDWSESPLIFFVILNAWLRRYQPDLVASHAANGYDFEADIMTDKLIDLSIDLQLSESITAQQRDDGGWDMVIVEEPDPLPDDTPFSPIALLKSIWYHGKRIVPIDLS